jgi:hypothetical protein
VQTERDNFDRAVELVELVAWKSFAGYLPPYPEAIALALIRAVPALRDANEKDTQEFLDQLLPVLRTRIAVQEVALAITATQRAN